jgi:hypothetical protein
MNANETAREWLLSNGYEETARIIDEIMAEWRAQGKATRRNWWEILSGDKHGNPRVVAGRTFPIIKAIRKRQGLPDCEKSVSNARRQKAPKIEMAGRWANES